MRYSQTARELFYNRVLRMLVGMNRYEPKNIIGPEVELGKDVTVEKGAVILGRTKIEEGRIEEGTLIMDAAVRNLHAKKGSIAAGVMEDSKEPLIVEEGMLASDVRVKEEGSETKKVRTVIAVDANPKDTWEDQVFDGYSFKDMQEKLDAQSTDLFLREALRRSIKDLFQEGENSSSPINTNTQDSLLLGYGTGPVTEATYDEVSEGFEDEYQVETSPLTQGVFINTHSDKSKTFARMLTGAFKRIEELAEGNDDLKRYFEELKRRKDNTSRPATMLVSSKLPIDSVRRFAYQREWLMIIFSKDFIDFLMEHYKDDKDTIEYLLAERLFHEFGHTNTVQYVQAGIREEIKLINWDIRLRAVEDSYKGGEVSKLIDAFSKKIRGLGHEDKGADTDYRRQLNEFSRLKSYNRNKAIEEYLRTYHVKSEYEISGHREWILLRNREDLKRIFAELSKRDSEMAQLKLEELLQATADAQGERIEDILVGRLARGDILDLTVESIEKERRAYFEANGINRIVVMVGGNGTLAVSAEALRDEKGVAVVLIQPITDNGGRSGEQEIELRSGKGRTIGLGDQAGAVAEGFLGDEYRIRKLYSNYNTDRNDLLTPVTMEGAVMYALINTFSEIFKNEKMEQLIPFIIEQLNMARIIDAEFSGLDYSDKAKAYEGQFNFQGKSVRNLNMLAVWHEMGAFADLKNGDEATEVDEHRARIAMSFMEQIWGVQPNFHVVPVALEPVTLKAEYDIKAHPISGNILRKLRSLDADSRAGFDSRYTISDDNGRVIGVYGQKFMDQLKGSKLVKFKLVKPGKDTEEDEQGLLPHVNPEAVEWLEQAHTIIIGPGSLYSSILSQFGIPGLAPAVRKSKARKKILFFNHVNMEETSNYTFRDYIDGIERLLNNTVIAESGQMIAEIRAQRGHDAPGHIRGTDDIYRGEDGNYYIQIGDLVNTVLVNDPMGAKVDAYIEANGLNEYGEPLECWC